jgi:hypothetical protein
LSSGIWDQWWTKHLAVRAKPADAIDEFWKILIDELIEVVTEDGFVDFRDPENIEAWVGPPWVTLELGREDHTVSARFWTQRKDMSTKHLFDKTLRISEDKADLADFRSGGLGSPAECGLVIGKFLFSLRTLEAQ